MKRLAVFALLGLLLGAGRSSAAVPPARDPDALPKAKTLYFDRQYSAARDAWQAVYAARGDDAALYWIARCSDALGERERALEEYARYLETTPSDRLLEEEARTSRVTLATRLYKSGTRTHLDVITDALRSPSKTVRYYAALQLSTLPREVSRPAIPLLRRIVEEEKDEDLVERAKLALLRVDARALPSTVEEHHARPLAPGALWIHVRIQGAGHAEPEVSIDLPLGLAELVFKSLPEEARRELNGRGYAAETFLRKLRELGPAKVLDVQGSGEKVKVWIE
jgi:hypothetical protein